MVSQNDLGTAFRNGRTSGKASNVEIRETEHHTVLVGYGHAAYAKRDKNTGEITFFEGWDGRSVSTSCQLTKTGVRSADHVSSDAPKAYMIE